MISDAQKKATAKYKSKTYDKIELRVRKGNRDIIKARAEKLGMSVNEYLNDLITKDLEQSKS
jgi:predicted HicB family RNase H-like nuclease